MTNKSYLSKNVSSKHHFFRATNIHSKFKSINATAHVPNNFHDAPYRKSYIAWDKLERANKPNNYTEKTRYLSKNAKALLSVIYQKLKKQPILLLNHKYISTITNSGSRQNQNIIKELDQLLDISYHRSVENHKGKKYQYVYKFIHKEVYKISSTQEVIKKKISLSNSTPKYSINKNYIINNRSRVQYSKGYLDFFSVRKNSEYEVKSSSSNKEYLKQNMVKNDYNEIKNKITYSISNSNGFLNSGKFLTEALNYLTDEVCTLIKIKCNKNYTNTMIRDIAKLTAQSTKGSKAFFYHINGLIAYLARVLTFEKRKFITKMDYRNTMISQAWIQEEIKKRQKEQYLTGIEYSRQLSSESRLKRKLAAVLEPNVAYKVLSNYQKSKKIGDIFKIYFKKSIAIKKTDEQIIFNQVRTIYENIEQNGDIKFVKKVEFIFPAKKKLRKMELERVISTKNIKEIKMLTIWEQIRISFIKSSFEIQDGINIDKNWLSKLIPDKNSNTKLSSKKILILKAKSMFVRDWINSHYLLKLESIAEKLGYKLLLDQYNIS